MPPKVEEDFAPRLSLLDRLTEAEEPVLPVSGIRGNRASRSDVRPLKACVLRDLSWLLNARFSTPPEMILDPRRGADPLQGTVVRFGLPDITNLDLERDSERQALLRWIRDTVRAFEPRLLDVEVSLIEAPQAPGRTVFRIDARLRCEPEPVRLSFDGEVVWRTRELRVR